MKKIFCKTGVGHITVQYRYIAKSWNGETIVDEVAASNLDEALELLQRRNLVLLELKEQSVFKTNLKRAALETLRYLGYRSYSNWQLMIFCRQFATMLQAGISLLECLKILSEQKEMASMQRQISTAAAEVEQGANLSSALQAPRNDFPFVMIYMVEAGEAGGMLDIIMDKLADHFEKQHDFKEKIRSATMYPAFIISVALAVMAIMVIFVLPQFADIFTAMGMEMPMFTSILLSLSEMISQNRFLLPFIVLFGIIGAIIALKTETGRKKFDRLCFHLPFLGKIYTQAVAARFARTLSTLLASGINLYHALQLTGKVVGNTAISSTISELLEAINHGQNMAAPMKENKYFPTLLTEMVRIGEETGALEHTLNSTALFYEKEVTYIVERLGTILEPALLLVVGFLIGLLVFSILSPMYRVFEMM